MRNDALERIKTLDCANKTLASCDPAAALPPEVLVWQKELAAASADDTAYAKALAKELRSLVCASDANAIHILRGIIKSGRLAETGLKTPALVDDIIEKRPVSASLTVGDKAKLLKIKQEVREEIRASSIEERQINRCISTRVHLLSSSSMKATCEPCP